MNRKFLLCLLGIFTLFSFAKEPQAPSKEESQFLLDLSHSELDIADHFQGELLPLNQAWTFSQLGRRTERLSSDYQALILAGTGSLESRYLADFTSLHARSTLTEYVPKPKIFILNRVLII